MSSRLSDTRIRSETQRWAERAKRLATKIKNKQAENNSIEKEINGIESKLSNPKYDAAKNNYNDMQSKIDTLNDKLKKSKSKKTKQNLSNQMNDLKRKKANYSRTMNTIANSKGFGSLNAKRTHKQRNLRNSNRTIKAWKNQKNHAVNQKNHYKSILNGRRIQRIRKRTTPKIMNHIKRNRANKHTSVYRTDMMDSTVFELIETSPNESESNDMATKPVDGNTQETNYINQSSRQYTGTYYLKGKNFHECDERFKKMLMWSYKYEFTVVGFSYWKHAYITSISKSTDNTINANGLIVSITFNYARQAVIKYKRLTKRGATKHKAGAKKQPGRRHEHANYVKVKPNMTYSQIARKTGTSLSTILKMNKWSPNSLPVGAKVRVK